MAANRERRSNAGKLNLGGAISAIDDMKMRREKGETRAHNLQLKDEGDVYEEMSEEQFQTYVKQRKQDEAGWVENDIGAEYYEDDGDWDGQGGEEGKKKWISNVNKPQRGGRQGAAVAGNDKIAAIFLGLQGQQRKELVRPAASGLARPMTYALGQRVCAWLAHARTVVCFLSPAANPRRHGAVGRSDGSAQGADGGPRPRRRGR